MDNQQISEFAQRLISMLQSGMELPGHIVDSINEYYGSNADQPHAPLYAPQQPQAPQRSLRDVLTNINQPKFPFQTGPQVSQFPKQSPTQGYGVPGQPTNWPPAGAPMQQQAPMQGVPGQPRQGSPLMPGINYGPLQ